MAKHSKRQTLRSLADELVALRQDLAPRRSWSDRSAAVAAKSETIGRLRQKGHRVNGVATAYHVYVIELDDEVGQKSGDPSLPWLYVGQSSKDPTVRIEEHRSGARNRRGPLFSRVAHRHFVSGRPDIYALIRPVFTQVEALELERETASVLREAGFSVRSN